MGVCQSDENQTKPTQQETVYFNHEQQQQDSQQNLSQQHQQNNDLYHIYSNKIQNNSNQLNSNRKHSQYPSGFSSASTESNTNSVNGEFISAKRKLDSLLTECEKVEITFSDGDIFEVEWLTANKADRFGTQSTQPSTCPSEWLDEQQQEISSVGSSSQNSEVVQQLMNKIRALAAHNQRNEQSLRDLQQQLHQQKRNSTTFILENEKNNNNKQALQKQKPLKPPFKVSQQIQPASSKIISQQKTNGMLAKKGTAHHLDNNYLSKQKQVPLKKKKVQASVAIAPVAVIPVKPMPQSEEKEKVQQSKAVEQTTSSESSKDDANVKEERVSVRLARLFINENCLQDILDYSHANEGKTVPRNCLAHHNIPALNRAKMIDWMIEVMKSYKCTEETFFMGVRIMDRFLQKSQKVKEISDLHIIGVTCMFIAVKQEEIQKIQLQVLQERIAHNKFSKDEIKDMESEILQTLNFSLLGTSPYEIVMQALTYAKYQDKFSKREFAYAHKISLYLSKMVLYDYEFYQASSYSLLATSIIFIVFKIFQQINPQFAAEHEIMNLLNILKVDQKDMVNCSTRIIHLAKNFEKFFPDHPNLKKFNEFEIKSTDDKNGETIFYSSSSLPQTYSEIFMLV